MYFVQQQENRHCQYGGFGSGLSREFQEAQRQREISSTEQYVLIIKCGEKRSSQRPLQ